MLFSWQQAVWKSTFQGGSPAASLLLVARYGTGENEFCSHLIQSLLCLRRDPTGNACGVCEDCAALANHAHPNYRELVPQSLANADAGGEDAEVVADGTKTKRASTQIRVDDVRALDDLMHLTSHGDGARVIWIHPAESMNTAASNALLKVLEEPPRNTYFVLLALQPAKLLPTILSRCLRVELPRPSPAEALQWLSKSGARNAELALALSGESPGRALAIDERQWEVRDHLLASMNLHVGGAEAGALPTLRIDEEDLPSALRVLQTWCWDLMAYKLTSKVRYHVDKLVELGRAADAVSLSDLLSYEQELRGARRLIEHPLNARLFVDALLLRYFHMTTTH